VENALSSLKDGDKIKINVKSGEITLQ
jgi:cell envelope opacity-associated protein A